MRFKIPPDWKLTLILVAVVVGLLALLIIEVAQRYPLN
jgi:hypothetical protein